MCGGAAAPPATEFRPLPDSGTGRSDRPVASRVGVRPHTGSDPVRVQRPSEPLATLGCVTGTGERARMRIIAVVLSVSGYAAAWVAPGALRPTLAVLSVTVAAATGPVGAIAVSAG